MLRHGFALAGGGGLGDLQPARGAEPGIRFVGVTFRGGGDIFALQLGRRLGPQFAARSAVLETVITSASLGARSVPSTIQAARERRRPAGDSSEGRETGRRICARLAASGCRGAREVSCASARRCAPALLRPRPVAGPPTNSRAICCACCREGSAAVLAEPSLNPRCKPAIARTRHRRPRPRTASGHSVSRRFFRPLDFPSDVTRHSVHFSGETVGRRGGHWEPCKRPP